VAKLLIVDSDDAYLEASQQRLTGENHIVDICNTAAEVPGKVVAGNYSMLLLEMDLPKLNVGDLLALLRNIPNFRTTRVILLSSADTDERRATAKQFECEFLLKTADGNALAGLVRHSFASRPPGLPPKGD
jgi:DNA-binding response OmpR family regulator